jgi:predicted nucleic acid-binding protein
MFLLDTNVISELRKAKVGRADRNVLAWASRIPAASLFLSVIVLQELEIGVLRAERRDTIKGAILRAWLHNQVIPEFAHRTLPVDTEVVLRSAAFHVPDPAPVRDALIAATGLVHGMTVVTRNISDFAPTRVTVVNPWDGP